MVKLSRKLIAPVLGVGLAILVGCAKKQDIQFASAKGPIETNGLTQRKIPTLTYQENGLSVTVPDLRGNWKAPYPENMEIVRIEQTGNKFSGYKTIGDRWVGEGSETIYGTVNERGEVVCYTRWNNGLVFSNYSSLKNNGNSFDCQGGDDSRTFERMNE